MRKMICGFLISSLFLVGCGTQIKTSPSNEQPTISYYSSGSPSIDYKLTKQKTQKLGKVLFIITNLTGMRQGPSGWTTNMERNRIEIREINGVDWKKAVAVKYSKIGPYFKALEQNENP
jgi:hypothetical protein